MAFCKNCGQELKEGVQFCASCGTPVNAQPQQEAPQQAAPQQPQQPQYTQQPQYAQQPQQQAQYAQPQYAPPVDDATANKGIAWLAYMGPLFLVPMFARKFSKYCQFHVRQGIPLCAAAIAYGITKSILMVLVYMITPADVSGVINVILNLGYIFFTVFSIIGIVNAATGKEVKLPLFGDIPIFNPLMDKFYGVK